MKALIVLAFGAGLLTPLSPCGFALLPAYLAAFINPGTGQAPALARLRRALGTAAAITAGFTATLTSTGAALAGGLGTVIHLIPWVAAMLGVVLIAAGTAMLAGRAIRLPARLSAWWRLRLPGIRPPAASGTAAGRWRLAGFGAGYAFASMSCTLAVLLSVVTQALTAGSLTTTIGVFAAYAAGSAVLLLALATTAALAESALSAAGIGRLTRHLPRISGALLAASGLYLTIYWIPALLRHGTTPGADPLSAASAALTAWISAHQNPVAGGAALLLTTAAIAVIAATRRSRPDQPDPCCAPRAGEQQARADGGGQDGRPQPGCSGRPQRRGRPTRRPGRRDGEGVLVSAPGARTPGRAAGAGLGRAAGWPPPGSGHGPGSNG